MLNLTQKVGDSVFIDNERYKTVEIGEGYAKILHNEDVYKIYSMQSKDINGHGLLLMEIGHNFVRWGYNVDRDVKIVREKLYERGVRNVNRRFAGRVGESREDWNY